jgi:hypothetical protein
MSAKKANTSKGKRYSAEEKQAVVDFVNKYNAEKGRGGQAAASKEFSISQLSIAGWLKASGSAPVKAKGKGKVKAKAKKGRGRPKKQATAVEAGAEGAAVEAPKAKGKRGRKPGSKNVVSAVSGGIEKKLDELRKVASEITRAEQDLLKLRTRFETLKASL